MKTIRIFLLALLALFSATSCEEEIADFTFSTKIVKTVDVYVSNTGGEEQSVSTTIILRLEDGDGEMNDYINKIKDVEIKKMSYRVSDFAGGDVELLFAGYDFLLDTHPIIVDAELHPYDDFVNGTIFSVNQIDIPESISTSNSQKMKIDKEIEAQFLGDYTAAVETNFTIEVTIELEVTASALD